MDLNLDNNITNNVIEKKFIKHLIDELQNYLNKNQMPENEMENKEEILFDNRRKYRK